MFDYLWWLLPSFMKKSLTKNSNLRGIFRVIADSLREVKTGVFKSRLSKFSLSAETNTDFYESDYPVFFKEHAKDKNLPDADLNTLLMDPWMRTFLGTKEGLKYYLEMMIPDIRVDFIYEIAADNMKWILFSKRELNREASFNRSVLLSREDRNLLEFSANRKTRIYSKSDLNKPEFLFWVKVYNRIKEDGNFAVHPESIIAKIDRLKPAHTKGYLVLNFIDVEVTNLSDGQVFIGETVNIEGTTVQVATA